MKETLGAIREKLTAIEKACDSLSDEQQDRMIANLGQIDKDLRGLILLCFAISKR